MNDALLGPFIEAGDEASRESALESIVVAHATPTIRRVLGRFMQTGGALQQADADDVASIVTIRLVRKLHACAQSEEEAIDRLADYVATQTFNAVYDLLRARFPEQARLKSRLRYVLTHDGRFALWTSEAGLTAGLSGARPARPVMGDVPVTRSSASAILFDRDRPADALFELFTQLGCPISFDALVRTFTDLWNVTDIRPIPPLTAPDERPNQLEEIESRQYLRALWSEIRELRAPQRAALLLNLRDEDGTNAVALFVLIGVATLDEIADAVGISTGRLAEIWRDLPLDDLTIAETLGMRRQQIINLRQAARDRLARRMAHRRRG
jgi:hypothetical protein